MKKMYFSKQKIALYDMLVNLLNEGQPDAQLGAYTPADAVCCLGLESRLKVRPYRIGG